MVKISPNEFEKCGENVLPAFVFLKVNSRNKRVTEKNFSPILPIDLFNYLDSIFHFLAN